MRRTKIAVSIFVLLLWLGLPAQLNGQYAAVKQATVKTTDGIKLNVWIEQLFVRLDQSIIIYYEVENLSAKDIHLVFEDKPDISISAPTIFFAPPYPSLIGHGRYEYTFVKIKRAGTHRGQLTIPGGKYGEERVWRIQVGFGYVTDVTGLDRRLGSRDDPGPLQKLLASRIKTLVVGEITVETNERNDKELTPALKK